MNQYETQAMREILLKGGFKECLSKEIADIYIINTCTVTGRADRESRYMVGLLHKTNPGARIIVTGCYVEGNAQELSFLPGISNIIRNADKARIAEILSEPRAPGAVDFKPAIHDTRSTNHELTPLSITDFTGRTKVFVKAQDGCDNFCAYCKIPLVRGPSRSRPIKDIVSEVKTLVDKGFREIVLTGICLGAWGADLQSSIIAKSSGLAGANLVDALKAIDKVGGSFRIRLSSIELKYVTDELIEFMAKNKRMCAHLHIPLQSGDDWILKKMNRPYAAQDYKALADKVKKRIKDAAITTDVLIGFPGESSANFRNTVNFIKDILPARTHIFTFSRRKGTAAYEMDQEVKNDVMKKRYYELNTAALSASYLYRKNFLGRILEVLAESRRDRNSGFLTGYSDNYIKVLFEGGDELARQIVPVKIKDINLMYTIGVHGEE